MNAKDFPRLTRRAGALLAGLVTLVPTSSFADNPFVQTNYTADPAPMVHNGRLYVYNGHDEDVTVNNFFTMNEWRVYSTTDVVNWTDHGSPLRYSNFTWAKGDAWAGHCIPRNGKFYYYVPMTQKSGAMGIGVAVSNSPTGPFTDALGRPLVTTGTGDIDPTAFIDDDGQAYLYWGNPNLWYVKLNPDMISYSGNPVQVSLTTAGFGTRKDTSRATSYEEGPWFYKRGGRYYMVFAANGIPEQILFNPKSNSVVVMTLSDQKNSLKFSAEGGLEETPDNCANPATKRILTDLQVRNLAKIALAIRRIFGNKAEQDIEWGIMNGRIFIVQSRPYIEKK